MSSLIPEGWIKASLKEVGKVTSGNAFKSTQFVSTGVPVVKISNIQYGEYVEKNQEYLPLSFINEFSNFQIGSGDLLLALTRPITNGQLKVCKYPKDAGTALLNQRVAKLETSKSLTQQFFEYYLRSKLFLEQVENGLSETLQPNLSPNTLTDFIVLLPPLAEQKVIADKLDELLALVESTKARLDAIPAILKSFRQSVLAAAVSGKLTEEWRGENDVDLWKVVKLGEVVGTIGQGWSPKCHNEPVTGEKWGVIKTSAVQQIEFIQDENKRLPESLKVREHLKVATGDILTTRAGPRVRCGVTCYVENVSLNLMICDKVYRYQVAEGQGVSKFLAMQLNSLSVLNKVEALKTGISESGMNLTQSKFKLLEINWPNIKEQTEIVRRVEELFAFADKIEAQVNAAQLRVNNLTQSILAKAFRGELTADWRTANPELICGENSAEALLKKIKAERSNAKPVKKPRAKKEKA
jgi:type I restriction enzyme S subunit